MCCMSDVVSSVLQMLYDRWLLHVHLSFAHVLQSHWHDRGLFAPHVKWQMRALGGITQAGVHTSECFWG